MKKRSLGICLALFALTLFLVPSTVGADCTEYWNSTRTYYPGYGYVCAGSGGTCTECVGEGGGSCTYNGPGSCDPTPEVRW